MLACACVRNDEAGAESALFLSALLVSEIKAKKKRTAVRPFRIFMFFSLSTANSVCFKIFTVGSTSTCTVLYEYEVLVPTFSFGEFIVFFSAFLSFLSVLIRNLLAQLGRSSSLRHDCWPVSRLREDKNDSKASRAKSSSSDQSVGLSS